MTETIEVVHADVLSATQRLVAEFERQANWIVELHGELAEAQGQRRKLAAALEELMAMLSEDARDGLMRRVTVATARLAQADPRVQRARGNGRPAEDGRRGALLRTLRDWPDSTIATFALTSALRRQGFEVPTRYAPNALFHLAKRGAVAQLGKGVYRINRLSEELRDGR